MPSLLDALEAAERIRSNYAKAISWARHPDDEMFLVGHERAEEHYDQVGTSALEIVLQAMVLGRRDTFSSVLDFPSGFGRVLRHFAAAFPDAEIQACDLDPDKVAFCAEQFGAVPLVSTAELAELQFPRTYDLIWCGSLLTHLPEPNFGAALSLIFGSLAPEGLGVVTLHGRMAPVWQRGPFPYLPGDVFAPLEAQYRSGGFGYADYAGESGYGISMSSPRYVARAVEADQTIRLLGWIERGWADHHDVLIVQKTRIDTPWSLNGDKPWE